LYDPIHRVPSNATRPGSGVIIEAINMNDAIRLDIIDPAPGHSIALSSDGSVRCTKCGRPASSASWRRHAGRLEVVARCTAHTGSRRRELAGLVEIGVTSQVYHPPLAELGA
jgi:hypothetical protein